MEIRGGPGEKQVEIWVGLGTSRWDKGWPEDE